MHPRLTRVRSIRFLLFEIKRVLVYNSTIFKLTVLFILYFFIHNVYADKKVFEKKVKKFFLTGQIDQKAKLLKIFTEPLNPRGWNL